MLRRARRAHGGKDVGAVIRPELLGWAVLEHGVLVWNYARQILEIRLLEATGRTDKKEIEHEIFGPAYLIKRPLLQAIDPVGKSAPVLLIDELDRADEEFEAFLLEMLSDFQITIPELGTIKAKQPPVVVITSNRTREIHDALKRRCLYFWIDYPSLEKELEIVKSKAPGISEKLAHAVVAFVQELRHTDLYKLPGVAETLDWSRALMTLSETELNHEVVDDTLGTLLKYHDDIAKIKGNGVAPPRDAPPSGSAVVHESPTAEPSAFCVTRQSYVTSLEALGFAQI